MVFLLPPQVGAGGPASLPHWPVTDCGLPWMRCVLQLRQSFLQGGHRGSARTSREMSPSALKAEPGDHITESATRSPLGLGQSAAPLGHCSFPSHFALCPSFLVHFFPLPTFQSSSLFFFGTTPPQPARKKHFLEYYLHLFLEIVKCPAALGQGQITPAAGKKEPQIKFHYSSQEHNRHRKGSKRGNEKELSHNRSIWSNEFNFPNSQFPPFVPSMFLFMQFGHNFRVALQCID